MVKHRRTKKYGITDGVSPLSSEFFLSDSSVLSLRSSSCGQNCGGNRHVYATMVIISTKLFKKLIQRKIIGPQGGGGGGGGGLP